MMVCGSATVVTLTLNIVPLTTVHSVEELDKKIQLGKNVGLGISTPLLSLRLKFGGNAMG